MDMKSPMPDGSHAVFPNQTFLSPYLSQQASEIAFFCLNIFINRSLLRVGFVFHFRLLFFWP